MESKPLKSSVDIAMEKTDHLTKKPLKSSVELAMEKTDHLVDKKKKIELSEDKETMEVRKALAELKKSQSTVQKKYEEVATENSMLGASYKKVWELANEANKDPDVNLESLPPSIKNLLMALKESGGTKNRKTEKADKVSTKSLETDSKTDKKFDYKVLNNEEQTQANIDNLEERFRQDENNRGIATTETTPQQPTPNTIETTVTPGLETPTSVSNTENLAQAPTREEGNETSSDQLFEIMTGARANLINTERALRQARQENRQGTASLERQLQIATEVYEKARADWARKLYLEKVETIERDLDIPRTDPRFEEHLRKYLPDLFNDTITREQDIMANERAGCLEPRRRTWFRTMLESYNRQPTWRKILIGSAVVAGGLATVGGASIGAAALFGVTKFVRGMIGAKVGALAGGIVKSIGGSRVERFRTNEIATQEGSFGRRVRTENPQSIDEWRNIIRDYDRMYNNTVREVNRRHRNITRWSIGAGIAAGGLATWASGPILENYFPKVEVPNYEPGPYADNNVKGPRVPIENTGSKPTIPVESPEQPNPLPNPTEQASAPIGDTGTNPTEINKPETNIILTPENIPSGILFDGIRDWAMRNYGITGLNDNVTIGEVVDPNFVKGSPEIGSRAFDELNSKIAFRNKVMDLINLREAGVSSMPAELKNSSLLEMLQQKI